MTWRSTCPARSLSMPRLGGLHHRYWWLPESSQETVSVSFPDTS
jgi:hypothetical protein